MNIETGYREDLHARIVKMHADYYPVHGFGDKFMSDVSRELEEFLSRCDKHRNGIFHFSKDGEILGTVIIDGGDLEHGLARLRWFIMDARAKGTGMGNRLMEAAMAHVDLSGFDACHLWTIAGLPASRHLYEKHGFVLTESKMGTKYGPEKEELMFIRKTPKISLKVTRFVDLDCPGWVEAIFKDAHGKTQIIHEKEPVISSVRLEEKDLPTHIELACQVVKQWIDPSGRSLSQIKIPWGIESVEEETSFTVLSESLMYWALT